VKIKIASLYFKTGVFVEPGMKFSGESVGHLVKQYMNNVEEFSACRWEKVLATLMLFTWKSCRLLFSYGVYLTKVAVVTSTAKLPTPPSAH
jgi:hypothetical protein